MAESRSERSSSIVPALSVTDLQPDASNIAAGRRKTLNALRSQRRASVSAAPTFADELEKLKARLDGIVAAKNGEGGDQHHHHSQKQLRLLQGVPRDKRPNSGSTPAAASGSSLAPTPIASRHLSVVDASAGLSVGFSDAATPRSPMQSARFQGKRRYGSATFTANVAATKAHLRNLCITAPQSLQKMRQELRAALHREYHKLHFATQYFLKRRAHLDPAREKEKRQEMLRAEIDATAEFLKQWEAEMADGDECQQRASGDADELDCGAEGTGGSLSLSISSPNSKRRTCSSHKGAAPSAPGSPMSDFGGSLRPPPTFTSVIDTTAVLSKKYEGPVVSASFRSKATATAQLGSGSSSPIDKSSLVRRSSSLSSPILHPIDRQMAHPHAAPAAGHFRTSSSLNSTQKSNDKMPSEPKKVLLEPLLQRGHANNMSHGTINGSHQPIPARRLEAPSPFLENEGVRHASQQKELAATNPALGFWFKSSGAEGNVNNGKKPRHHVTEPTASSLLHAAPLTLTFFDEKGQIDGRDDVAEMKISRAYGTAVTTDQFVAYRSAMMQEERRRVHERQVLAREAALHSLQDSTMSQSARSIDAPPAFSAAAAGASPAGKAQNTLQFLYQGPSHAAEHKREIDPPSAERITELLSTVFVRGGDVAAYIKQMHREAQRATTGLNGSSTGSTKKRLGGVSTSRHLL